MTNSSSGNTRVVGQDQLQQFQEEMGKVLFDPFQVVMRQTRAPISLLQEKAKVLELNIKKLKKLL